MHKFLNFPTAFFDTLQLEYLAAEYYPDHWYHKEAAVVDPNWTWGAITDKRVSKGDKRNCMEKRL